jgi:amidohydrolase
VNDELESCLVRWRRELHQCPEIAFEEHETTARLLSILGDIGVAVQQPLATGAVVSIRGPVAGPVIAVRADIDGLPVTEETGLPFASRRDGFMHACGHDGHMAVGLGLVAVLSAVSSELRGEVRVLFQPAEEPAEGGAKALLAAGVLDGVDAALGFHLWSGHPVGEVQVHPGAIMASTDEFRVTVRGRGGHGAAPHLAVDPIVIAGEIVGQLQTIVSRRIDPLAAAVVTVASIHGGSVFNVIPGEVTLTGTTRALNADVRLTLHREIERIASHTALAHGGEATCELIPGVPVLVNDAALSDIVHASVDEILGPGHIVSGPPQMGGDDFAFIAERVPSCYPLIGARSEQARSTYSHHHPKFNIDERSLGIALRVLLLSVQRSMTEHDTAGLHQITTEEEE